MIELILFYTIVFLLMIFLIFKHSYANTIFLFLLLPYFMYLLITNFNKAIFIISFLVLITIVVIFSTKSYNVLNKVSIYKLILYFVLLVFIFYYLIFYKHLSLKLKIFDFNIVALSSIPIVMIIFFSLLKNMVRIKK